MTKKDALNIVFSCAISYKENLAGRSFLFVTADKHKVVRGLEVTFDSSNFLHMTGFKLSNKEIGANNFLSMCCDKRLSEMDFEFAADGTTEMKLRVLPDLVQKHLSAKMVGDYDITHPKLYTDKLAGSISACVGFVKREGSRFLDCPQLLYRSDHQVTLGRSFCVFEPRLRLHFLEVRIVRHHATVRSNRVGHFRDRSADTGFIHITGCNVDCHRHLHCAASDVVVDEIAGSFRNDPSRIAMVNCVITLGQDGIAQTHVQLATAQTVLCHVVYRVAILAVRVVLHARHITHQPRTIGLDILDLDSHSRIVRDAVVGRLFDLTTCGVAIHTDVQRNRSLQQSRMHIQAAIMDNQLVVADRFTIRVNDRMNIQCRATLGVGVDSYQIRSQELVVVMAEIAGLILVVPLKIIIGARTICVQRQGADGAIGHKRDIGLAFLDIFLLQYICG